MNKDLDYYVNLPWVVQVCRNTENGEPYYYEARDLVLRGALGTGKTLQAAIKDLWTARGEMLEWMLELGDPIPEPCDHMIALPAHATITSTGSIE